MKKIIVLLISLIIFSSEVFAYKVFYYDEEGNRIYRTVTQEEFKKNKNKKRRAYIRQPRTNWEITDSMRARKRTYFYKGKY